MSTIKSSSEDLTLNADGSNDIKFQSNGVEKASISSAGAFTSTTIDATKLTGEKRNFIIDGDFTQWPEGETRTSLVHTKYGPALWVYYKIGDSIVIDVKRTADAPTVAQSGHSSSHCMEVDVTTAEAAVAAGDKAVMEYFITGTDFGHLNQQQITISFWHKFNKSSGGDGAVYGFYLGNSASDRSYPFQVTQTTNATWEKHTETITLDTSGTWLLTEADKGLRLGFTLFNGTNYHGTAQTWQAGQKETTSSQVNGGDNTANYMRISQVGLYLGSTAPTFTSPPIATVKDQVEYYVEKQGGAGTNAEQFSGGFCNSTTSAYLGLNYRHKRANPAVSTTSTTAWYVYHATDSTLATTNLTFDQLYQKSARIVATVASGLTVGRAAKLLVGATPYILIDARH